VGEPTGALPSLVYIWENASERAFHERTAAAILVLLAFMIVMNAAAIFLRRRFERRW
jgi:phosphate transport system permease protein